MPFDQTKPVTNTADPSQQKQQQNKGTGFTNINSILDANQGAGQRIGSTIGNNLNKQAQDVRSGIQAGQNQFQQQKNQAAGQARSNIQAGQDLTKQAGENDEAYQARVAQGNRDYAAIGNNLRNAEYSGPMGIQGVDKLQAQGANATSQGRMASNAQGQSELLKSMVAGPGQYTRGQNALDSLLLGQQGQGAIQQGRRATQGLQQQAQNAATNAQTQAQGLKSGLANDRDDTLAALQNAVTGDTGIKAQGTKQAEDFRNNASMLSEILSGQYVPKTEEEKAKAQEVLNHMEDYGLQDYDLYDKDDTALRNALAQLGSTKNLDFGNAKYTENQRGAGVNLAQVLNDKALQDEISGSKFNTNVFGDESQAFGGLDAARTRDEANKAKLMGFGNDLKAYEDYKVGASNTKIDSQINAIQNATDIPQETKDQILAYLNQTKLNSSHKITNPNEQNGFNIDNPFFAGEVGGNLSPELQKAQSYINSAQADYSGIQNPFTEGAGYQQVAKSGVGFTPEEAIEAELRARYGTAASGSYNADKRNLWGSYENNLWGGLGLGGENLNNGVRSSSSVLSAANKQVGPSDSLRNYALQKLLGITPDKDINSKNKTVTQK